MAFSSYTFWNCIPSEIPERSPKTSGPAATSGVSLRAPGRRGLSGAAAAGGGDGLGSGTAFCKWIQEVPSYPLSYLRGRGVSKWLINSGLSPLSWAMADLDPA